MVSNTSPELHFINKMKTRGKVLKAKIYINFHKPSKYILLYNTQHFNTSEKIVLGSKRNAIISTFD